MQKEAPLVSVLMTAYNREKYIADAIESVINSTYQNWELIIVDDCSKDKTIEIAKSFEKTDSRIRVYLNEKNIGDYPNRNVAAGYAKGKYIKYLDSDDIIYPHGLQVMTWAIEKFPEAGFALSSQSGPKSKLPVCLSPRETYLEHFNGFNHFDRAPGSSIINLEAFNKVGGFSGKRMIGDYELWFILARNFNMVKMPRDLVWDRIHEGQESKSDYAKQYKIIREEVIINELFMDGCPLEKYEVDYIIKGLKKMKFKQRLKKILYV